MIIGGETMSLIENPIFSERERAHLEVVLRPDFPEKARVVERLNRMKDGDLTRDVTPYYRILEFRPEGANPGQGPMQLYVSVEVGTIPTVFLLYGRSGLPFELEIFNADSSVLDLDAILEGQAEVRYPEDGREQSE